MDRPPFEAPYTRAVIASREAAASNARPSFAERLLPAPLVTWTLTLTGLGVIAARAKGVQDPDYFWHMATAEWIVEHGRIPDADPFSFTWGGQPWLPHEWLGELLMHQLVFALGPLATMALFGAIVPAAVGVLGWRLGAAGLRSGPVGLAMLAAALVFIPYATIRPQTISWALIALLLALLVSMRPDRWWLLLALPPLFALWANLHGLWVIGVAIVGLYALATAAGRTPMAGRFGSVALAAGAVAVAVCLSPGGVATLLYPLRYVDPGDWGLANIPEWQSPNFHDAVQWPLLALFVLASLTSLAAPGWLRLLWIGGLLLALGANRNAPVAAVMAVPALAYGFAGAWPANRIRGGRAVRRLMEVATAAAVLVVAFVAVPPQPGTDGIVLDRYPTLAIERLRHARPDRVLGEYGWGGYVIHELAASGTRVFVDGRNDMYDQAILEEYSAIRSAEPGWQDRLRRWRVDAVVLPPDAPLAKVPTEPLGWCSTFRDARQVLLEPCASARPSST